MCCCSVTKSCLTLCKPMDCSAPGFPVSHHLLELVQVHVLLLIWTVLLLLINKFSLVQSLSRVWLFVIPDMQHARPPCPSLTPEACSNSCPLSRWCHPTISSSVIPFSCLQSSPASGSFSNESVLHIRWPKYWSFSYSGSSLEGDDLPMNIQDWFPLELTGLILKSKGLSRVFSSTTVWKHQFFGTQPSLFLILYFFLISS